MLGPAKSRHLNEPKAVSLEDLAPQDHCYRHPVVFFKLQLLLFCERIRSGRGLIETASLNLTHCWYLGYVLDEELPDHSSLIHIRQRRGIGVAQADFIYDGERHEHSCPFARAGGPRGAVCCLRS